MVLELNASNGVIHAYVNGPGIDQPIERIGFINGTPRQRQVFHADGLGSIAALTDESGEPVQTYAYEAFGKVRARTGADLNRVTYTAREAMGDSLGFYYYRNRILDPNTGRFTSEDPLGFIDAPNRYVYVINNPINFLDPWGEEDTSLTEKILIGAAAYAMFKAFCALNDAMEKVAEESAEAKKNREEGGVTEEEQIQTLQSRTDALQKSLSDGGALDACKKAGEASTGALNPLPPTP